MEILNTYRDSDYLLQCCRLEGTRKRKVSTNGD